MGAKLRHLERPFLDKLQHEFLKGTHEFTFQLRLSWHEKRCHANDMPESPQVAHFSRFRRKHLHHQQPEMHIHKRRLWSLSETTLQLTQRAWNVDRMQHRIRISHAIRKRRFRRKLRRSLRTLKPYLPACHQMRCRRSSSLSLTQTFQPMGR